MKLEDTRIAVIGLGYVGLPLAVAFSRFFPTLGFDTKQSRIDALRQHRDLTREVSEEELKSSGNLRFSSDPGDLESASVYIVTVPTPIDEQKRPEMSALAKASELVGRVLKSGDIVVYESTVYPGATEEYCVPILERESGLVLNNGFSVGYSPERINPGDSRHRLADIVKVTSGSDAATADFVDALYARIIAAGTHRASSIRVAEAAKVIENTQRDLNIALINELSIIFQKLGLDTTEILEAAGTKWNFLPFRPGLVGGHCISVDPYYLTHKAQSIGYHPEVILAGRRINDEMGMVIGERVIKLMSARRMHISESRILLMGLSFKENCPDLRNTRVIDIVSTLKSYNVSVDVYDPWVNSQDAKEEFGIELITAPEPGHYDAVIVAVAHDLFRQLGAEGVRKLSKPDSVIFDVKSLFPSDAGFTRL